MGTIKIDVISDVACPWCYVGKRRFEEALKQWSGASIEVTWHPFQLDPTMRSEGMNRNAYLTNKFGSLENVQGMIDRLTDAGKTVGVDFGDDWLAVNTLPLHQLLNVARTEGFDVQLKERFLAAYFEESKHLNDLETLYMLLADFGWNKEKVDSIINDEKIANSVKAEIALYQQRGVTGVPFFVINDEYGISGAQPVEAFLEAFQSVSPISEVENKETCDPNSGCC